MISVIEGHVKLSRPVTTDLFTLQQLSVGTREGVGTVRTLSPDDVQELVAWRSRHSRLVDSPIAPIVVPAVAPNSTDSGSVAPPPPPQNTRLNEVPIGWCCLSGGKVQKENAIQCKNANGAFYADEKAALASCPVIVK